jgi:hypothetical protein
MQPRELVDHAAQELKDVLPGIDLSGAQLATYRIDRAEGTTASGARPDDVCVLTEGGISRGVHTVWPTKLALVPRLIDRLKKYFPQDEPIEREYETEIAGWPRPRVAALPWETATQWFDVR